MSMKSTPSSTARRRTPDAFVVVLGRAPDPRPRDPHGPEGHPVHRHVAEHERATERAQADPSSGSRPPPRRALVGAVPSFHLSSGRVPASLRSVDCGPGTTPPRPGRGPVRPGPGPGRLGGSTARSARGRRGGSVRARPGRRAAPWPRPGSRPPWRGRTTRRPAGRRVGPAPPRLPFPSRRCRRVVVPRGSSPSEAHPHAVAGRAHLPDRAASRSAASVASSSGPASTRRTGGTRAGGLAARSPPTTWPRGRVAARCRARHRRAGAPGPRPVSTSEDRLPKTGAMSNPPATAR